MDCPDDSTLALRLQGALAPARADDVDAHVESCAACYELMVELASLVAPSGTLPPGRAAAGSERSIGRYELLAPIGAGGMGVVWRARDPELGREVAVKIHGAGPARLRERMIREAQAMARLHHPNVVEVFDVVAEADRVCIVMALVHGSDAAEWARSRVRTVAESLRVYRSAALGLAAAHDAGVVHRDVKPHNILVRTGDADVGGVLVADFGLAITDERSPSAHDSDASGEPAGRDAAMTRPGAFVGTPRYMAPEQLAGAAATRESDQFALAVALFEALFGRRPFADDDRTRTHVEIPAVPSVPTAVSRALVRALDPDPTRRLPSMAVFADALASRAPRRRPVLALGLASAAVLATAAVMIGDPAAPALGAATPAAESSELDEIFDVRERVAIARGLRETGEFDAARAALDLAEQTTVDRPLARAAVDIERGHLAAELGATEDATAVLEAGYFAAREHGADELAIDAAIALSDLDARDEQIEAAREWIEHARALVDDTTSARARAEIAIAAGNAALQASEAELAVREFQIAVAATEASDGALSIAAPLGALCMALFDAGREAEAESACARSVAIGIARFGEDDTMVANVRFAWGTNLLERDRPDEAVPLVTNALDVQRRVYGETHRHVATSTLVLGMAELARGDVATAERLIRRGVELCASVSDACTVAALLHLGEVLETKGDLDGALAAVRRAEVEVAGVASSDTFLGSAVASALGAVLLGRGEIDLALPELERAHASCLQLFGPDHPRTQTAAATLAQANDELRARSEEAARR